MNINETIGIVKVKAGEVIGQLTMQVKVTGLKRFRSRLWVGCKLIRLAARVMGCGVKIETDE